MSYDLAAYLGRCSAKLLWGGICVIVSVCVCVSFFACALCNWLTVVACVCVHVTHIFSVFRLIACYRVKLEI